MLVSVLRFEDNIKVVARNRLKRVSAFAVALIMCGQLSARAIAPALAVAGVAAPAVISAFLAACGIYLYDKGEEGSADGTYGKVVELWDEFRGWYIQQFPSSPEPPQDFSGFVTLGGIYLSAKVFDLLAQFARWLKDRYSLGDNDTNVDLGGVGYVPYYGVNLPSYNWVAENGWTLVGGLSNGDGTDVLALAQSGSFDAKVVIGAVPINGGLYAFYGKNTVMSAGQLFDVSYSGGGGVGEVRLRNYYGDFWYFSFPLSGYRLGVGDYQVYSSLASFLGADVSAGDDVVGISTGDISIPQELPEGAEAGGIYIPGVTDSTTPGEVEAIISQSIVSGQYPDIRPIPVEVQDGVTVTDDGVAPGAIVIGSAQVPVPITAYQLSGLETVWPFSIPWDVLQILSSLNAEPQAPKFEFELYLGVGTYDIVIDLSEWDSAARICRAGEYLLFVVGLCMFLYRKFG